MKFRVAICLCLLMTVSAFGQVLTPINLTVEYRSNPLGVGEAMPRLAWLFQSSAPNVRGQTQYAYEIRVASKPAILAAGKADLWESGKTFSRMCSQIEYGGNPLDSGQQCWWQVRVWNGANEAGPWSAPATWSAGLSGRADWKADWIGLDSAMLGRTPPMHLVDCQWVWTNEDISEIVPRTRYFRGQFVIPEGRAVKSALLGMTASDSFSAWVNGVHVLSGHDRQVLSCGEVSFALHNGVNVIAVQANSEGNYPALAGRLEIRFTQGPVMVVDVDQRWKSATEMIRGWQMPTFEDLTWKRVQTLGPVGRQPWGQPTQVKLPLDPALYLRREFKITKKVARATLYATALGDYQFHINGQVLAPGQMAPAFSDYRRRVYYQTYDVTSQLQIGHNALGIVLTDGWYAGYWPSNGRTHNYGGDPRAFAQLEIEFEDGTTVAVCTDDKWRMSLGPIRNADRVLGTINDERVGLGDWDSPLYKLASDWVMPTVGLTVPEPDLDADPGVPMTTQETFTAKAIRENLPGDYVADFGMGLAGHVRLHGWAARGQIINVQYGNELNSDGTIRTDAAEPDANSDIFVAGKTGDFTFDSSFTEHRFRYVEISGLTHRPDTQQILAIGEYPNVDRTGWFVSTNQTVNMRAIHALWAERMGAVDAPSNHFLAAASAAYEDNLAPLYYRLLDTLSDESHISAGGAITATSPLDHDPLVRVGGLDAEPIVLWELLRMYGDTRIVRRHMADLIYYENDLRANWQEYAHHDPFFADARGGSTEDSEMIAQAYCARVADMISQMAAAIGDHTTSEDYQRMAGELSQQFRDRYLSIESHSVIHTQTGYALALKWGFVPEELRNGVGEQLVRQINRDGGKFNGGALGRSQVLFALSDSGQTDTAYRLVESGSYNDPWASRWLFENAAGISPVAFGFNRIRIEPRITDTIPAAGAIYDSTAGRIVSKWQRDKNQTQLIVHVPINCTADLFVNTENDAEAVQESGQAAEKAPGITVLRREQAQKVFELRSGDYTFTMPR